MSVGFGFSVGDFLKVIELVISVRDALRESGEAGAQYGELMRQLDSLETALLHVKQLDLTTFKNGEGIALSHAVAHCGRTIEDFLNGVRKYQPHLKSGGSGSKAKDAIMKVRWALCKKDDVARFKLNLLGHTKNIELLLTTVHM
jgi:hypothetical protein